MALLIDIFRQLAMVPSDAFQVDGVDYWSDEQLQLALDGQVSARLIDLPIRQVSSTDPDGRIVFKHGRIPQFSGHLDVGSVLITDVRGELVDGVTVEPDGRLTFEQDQSGVVLYASGLAYDLNAAAADVLDAWSVAASNLYDITIDGQSMKRSQAAAGLTKRAETFRARALPKTVRLTRRDVSDNRSGNLASKLGPWFEQWGNG